MPIKPKDLLNATKKEIARSHKRRRLVPSPVSYFVDVKCASPGCMHIATLFSRKLTVPDLCRGAG